MFLGKNVANQYAQQLTWKVTLRTVSLVTLVSSVIPELGIALLWDLPFVLTANEISAEASSAPGGSTWVMQTYSCCHYHFEQARWADQ